MMAPPLVPVVLLATVRFGQRDPRERTWPQRIHRWRFECLALVLFVVFLAAPLTIRTTTLVYHRLLPPVWSLVAISAAAHGPGASARPLARALRALASVASLLIAWPTFADTNRYSDLDTVMASMQPGPAVTAVNFRPDRPNRLWSPAGAENHVVAALGSRSLDGYSMSSVSPVVQRPNKQWIEPSDRLNRHPYQLRPDWAFTRLRYLLLATPQPPLAEDVRMALQDDAALLAAKGESYLSESRLPLVPIDMDHASLPISWPPTLQKQMRNMQRELQERDRQKPNIGSEAR
jgi:hypothetical protein